MMRAMSGSSFFDFHAKMKARRPAPATAAGAAGPASGKAADGADALTVTQLTHQIDAALKGNLPQSLAVKGEVSNYKHHGSSGHTYFTLKDEGSCIDCVMFRTDAARVRFEAGDGMELLAIGRVGVYGARGRYQLYVTRLEPLGQGALELALRQLRAKLEAEGLFAPGRKRTVPKYPRRVALVTSAQTAALQDMLKVLRRFPWLRLMLYHVPVQGDGSAEKIAAALHDIGRGAGAIGGVDVILLGRGGGSLEDLWEFNEEVVARAIVASPIPVVTGIGHEVDTSIADLAADHHAHTPTEAAQVVVRHWRTAREVLDQAAARLRREARQVMQSARQRLGAVESHEFFRRPLERVNQLGQLTDDRQRALALAMSQRLRRAHAAVRDLALRLEQHSPRTIVTRVRASLAGQEQALAAAVHARLRRCGEATATLSAALRERHPRHAIRFGRERTRALNGRMQCAIRALHDRRAERAAAQAAHLNAVGPQQVLKRGYSITTLKKGGAVVRSVTQVRPGDRLITRLADGSVESLAEDPHQLPLFGA